MEIIILFLMVFIMTQIIKIHRLKLKKNAFYQQVFPLIKVKEDEAETS